MLVSFAELEGKEVGTRFGRERETVGPTGGHVGPDEDAQPRAGCQSVQPCGQAWRHGCEGWQHFGGV